MEIQQAKNSVSLYVKGLHCYCSNSCSLRVPWIRKENSMEAHSIPDNAQIKYTPLDIIKFYFWITLLQIGASTLNSTNHSSQNLLFRNIQIKLRFKACLFKHSIWITKMKDNRLNSPGHSSVASYTWTTFKKVLIVLPSSATSGNQSLERTVIQM